MYQPPSQQGWSNQSPPPYQYQPPPQGWPPNRPSPPKRWHQSNVGIVVMLILFFPAGLYLMWRHATWPSSVKGAVTSIPAIIGIVNAVATGQIVSNATQSTQIQQSDPTAPPSAMPTPAFVATKGTPLYKGMLSDFVGAYGQPSQSGTDVAGPYNFIAGTDQDAIIISVNITSNQVVSRLSVIGPGSWKATGTRAFCRKFFPVDAALFNSYESNASNLLYDYHSASAKDFVLSIQGGSSCLLYPFS